MFAASFLLLIGGTALALWRMRRVELAPAAAAVLLATFAHGLVDVYWVRCLPVLGFLLVGMVCGLAARRRPGPARDGARGSRCCGGLSCTGAAFALACSSLSPVCRHGHRQFVLRGGRCGCTSVGRGVRRRGQQSGLCRRGKPRTSSTRHELGGRAAPQSRRDNRAGRRLRPFTLPTPTRPRARCGGFPATLGRRAAAEGRLAASDTRTDVAGGGGLGRVAVKHTFVVGAVLLLRREALDDVGLVDERFFLYAEEADWQRRARERMGFGGGRGRHRGARRGRHERRRTPTGDAVSRCATDLHHKVYGRGGWRAYRVAAVSARPSALSS